MAELGVVHLVRQANGVAPFASFIRSYTERPAGAAHELIVIFKGFDGAVVPGEYQDLLHGLAHRLVFFPDEGFDIRSYFAAARAFDYHHYLFLNSFSVILGDNWLGKMYGQTKREGVGIVGATGSYESTYSNYAGELRRGQRRWFHRGSPATEYRNLRAALRLRLQFAPFPNYHLRSNAFLIPRDLMLRLKTPSLEDRQDALRFESGRNGWTRQVAAMGLRALVVGLDGRGYEKESWPESFTFRIGEQHNLLVADNRTRQYEEADEEFRRFMTKITWGRVSQAGCGAGQISEGVFS